MAFPRATATWMPAAAVELVRRRGIDAWRLVRETDTTLREFFATLLPGATRQELERLRGDSDRGLESFSAAASEIDRSLPQMVESARGKIDYQYRRLLDGVLSKVRSRFDRAHPEVGRLRQVLMPQDRPQERRRAWLDVVAHGGGAALEQVSAVAEQHIEATLAGDSAHYLLPLEARGNR